MQPWTDARLDGLAIHQLLYQPLQAAAAAVVRQAALRLLLRQQRPPRHRQPPRPLLKVAGAAVLSCCCCAAAVTRFLDLGAALAGRRLRTRLGWDLQCSTEGTAS